MTIDIKKYKTLIFDCDGVILNSNRVKTMAFYESAVDYGHEAAKKLVDYHVEHGGISRFEKFKYFFTNILKRKYSKQEYDKILESYASKVHEGLMSCDIARGLNRLKASSEGAKWLVASGGAQNELNDIFAKRGLLKYFDGGVYGSPTAKDVIVEQQLASGIIQSPSLFIGDSRFDHIVADSFNFDFLFVTQWSEFKGLAQYAKQFNLPCEQSLETLVDSICEGKN